MSSADDPADKIRWTKPRGRSFDEKGQRDLSWPGSEFGPPIWQPENPTRWAPHIEVDATWWMSQQGLPDEDRESGP